MPAGDALDRFDRRWLRGTERKLSAMMFRTFALGSLAKRRQRDKTLMMMVEWVDDYCTQ